MKIQAILEAKFSSASYAYHATNLNHLRSILKQGLLPNKESGGYASSSVSSNFGYSLSPLAGVYFTDDIHHAEHIAKQVDGSGLIVIAKIEKRTASMDEDQLAAFITSESDLIKSIRKNESTIKSNPQAFITNVVDNIIQYKLPENINKNIINNIRPDLTKYIELLVKSQATDEIEDWGSARFNNEIKQYQTSLTKKLKTLLHNNYLHQDTFKVDGPIGFNGANKIVGLYNFNSGVGWGDLGEFERDAYHKVKSPIELIPR